MKTSFHFILVILMVLVTSAYTVIEQSLPDPLAESMERGEKLYNTNCIACHRNTGEGIANVFPPLAKSDYLMADRGRAIRQIAYGANGEMTVNGVVYNGSMPPFDLSDQEIADIMNYIMNSWGNEAPIVTPEEVEEEK